MAEKKTNSFFKRLVGFLHFLFACVTLVGIGFMYLNSNYGRGLDWIKTETFEQIHREHQAAMIIISHQERIIQLADEIAVIAGGRIAHRGTTEEILPLILADTLGGCPVLNREEARS